MAFPVMMIAIAVTLGIVLFGAAFLVFSLIMRNLADFTGSWRSLAAAYPGIGHEPDHSMVRQTIQIGVVTYKACVRVGIEPKGLWLGRSMVLPFMRPSTSIFIPWREIRRVSPGTLYWERAYILHVGLPEIGTVLVPGGLFAKMSHLLKNHVGEESTVP
jgi:hypothetical protein